jgi:hypothetical protein
MLSRLVLLARVPPSRPRAADRMASRFLLVAVWLSISIRPVRRSSLASLAAGLLSFSCADLLGEVDFGAATPEPTSPAPDSVAETPAPSAAEPTLSGVGGPPSSLPSGGVQEDNDLGSTDQPVSAAPSVGPVASDVCAAGRFRCDDAELELCLDGAAWVSWQTCGSAMLCQSEPAGRCLPQACAADTFRCVDGSLERCDQDLTGWTEVAVCATSAHCDPRQGRCLDAPCLPGQQRCNGDQLEQCSDDRLGWNVLETCASASLCAPGSTPDTARCSAPACASEQYSCTDSGVLQVCNLERTGFSNLAQCSSAALCNAELGSCRAPSCRPGQHSCSSSGEILICNAEQTGFTAQAPRVICDADQTCDAARGLCIDPPAPPPPPPVTVEDEDEDEDEDGNSSGDDDDDDEPGRGNGRDGDRGNDNDNGNGNGRR